MFRSEHLLSILDDLLPCHRSANSEILEFFEKRLPLYVAFGMLYSKQCEFYSKAQIALHRKGG